MFPGYFPEVIGCAGSSRPSGSAPPFSLPNRPIYREFCGFAAEFPLAGAPNATKTYQEVYGANSLICRTKEFSRPNSGTFSSKIRGNRK